MISGKVVRPLGVPVSLRLDKGGGFISFVNPYSLFELSKSAISSDRLNCIKFYADGILLCLAIRMIFGQKADRLSFDFTSIASHFFFDLNRAGGTLALVGGTDGVTKKFKEYLSRTYPSVRVIYTGDGFFPSEASRKDVAWHISGLRPDCVLIGMGAVHQETFLLDLLDVGYEGTAYTCGGFFDQTVASGGVYYPEWINKMHLRWAYRLYKEPVRLAKRYFVDYFMALYFLARYKEKRLCKI